MPERKVAKKVWSGCRATNESAGESGDGSIAYIISEDNEGIISGFCDTNMQLIC